ncbi:MULTISPECIES: hypothetical protein [unclassified Lysobacter]|uniref:hypothetical protein n=1 Tax=unclassified Lysobacter TaxID=2635362 RepID=UPI001BE5DE04|nr:MULTISPECIES: hypothetical protein [unclassified Lysobacter]MBT2746290.1 hypothetical protein [Lysobacter sp. ISL-42]MBT2751237.1 hypothetical protein [Lysobacter sp. ISL-50]MBT2775645.1 hypothetical protein [Lysobacter sp. ISL-54]MBT2780030.1 hypothetical protein [Lysobacter sp. ISL-52]
MSADRPNDAADVAPISAFELRAMAALLAQGRWLCAASLLLWLAALLGLILGAATPPWVPIAWPLSLLAGLAQLYYAIRVDFDARLLQALAESGDDAHAARRLDAALLGLGLLKPGHEGRDWPRRWRGARGLLLRQALVLIVQFAALIAPFGRVWL